MLRGGLAADAGARALQTCMEMTLPKEAEVELEQVMRSLGSGGKEEINNQSDTTGMLIDDQGRMVIRIPAHLQHVLLGPRAKAYMARPAARPAVDRTSVEDDKSNICTDCGASMTITGSLANTTDVQAKSVHGGEWYKHERNPHLYEDILCKEQDRRSGYDNHASAICQERPPRFIEWKGMQSSKHSHHSG